MEGFTMSSLLNQVCDKLGVYQFALAGKSTTHALVYFFHALLRDTCVHVIFADFSKGFDFLDHNVLVQEL